MIQYESKGDFTKTKKFLNSLIDKYCGDSTRVAMHSIGQQGVLLLEEATPKKTGLTSKSWKYKIVSNINGYEVIWYNTNVQNGENIALLIQYGHGTKRGVYVKGRDYINPAIKPLIDNFANQISKEIKKQ